MADGTLPPFAAAMLRLFSGTSSLRKTTIALEIAGEQGVVWTPGDEQRAAVGLGYLVRQAACIGGGTVEMARNNISERLLGMPRDRRADDGAFRDVPRSPTSILIPLDLTPCWWRSSGHIGHLHLHQNEGRMAGGAIGSTLPRRWRGPGGRAARRCCPA